MRTSTNLSIPGFLRVGRQQFIGTGVIGWPRIGTSEAVQHLVIETEIGMVVMFFYGKSGLQGFGR